MCHLPTLSLLQSPVVAPMGSACQQTAQDQPRLHHQITSHRRVPPSLPRGQTHLRLVGHGMAGVGCSSRPGVISAQVLQA